MPALPARLRLNISVVAHPVLNSKADSFNCGPGTVTLKANVGGSANRKMVRTSGRDALPVGGGSPGVTPFLGATDTFYGSSKHRVRHSLLLPLSGQARMTTTGSTSPYYRSFWANKVQYLIDR